MNEKEKSVFESEQVDQMLTEAEAFLDAIMSVLGEEQASS